jgi:hypothetical protein
MLGSHYEVLMHYLGLNLSDTVFLQNKFSIKITFAAWPATHPILFK